MKYITDNKKKMTASEIVEEMIAYYGQTAFDKSGWITINEQVYAINEMIAYLKGYKDILEDKPNNFYDYLKE